MQFQDMDFLDQEGDSEEEAPETEEDGSEAEGELFEELSEAERRLNLAAYYKQLAKGGIFPQTSEEARIVDQEVRQFARDRMNALIGIRAEAEASPLFTEPQVNALRQWADHMIERASRTGEPTVKKVEPPAQPKAAPVMQPIAAPAIKQRKPATKPAPEKPKKAKSRNYDDIPTGEVFEENGRKYVMAESPRPGPDGRVKRVKMDVTGQTRPAQTPSVPSRAHLEAVYASQANQSAEAGIGSAAIMQVAIANSLKE